MWCWWSPRNRDFEDAMLQGTSLLNLGDGSPPAASLNEVKVWHGGLVYRFFIIPYNFYKVHTRCRTCCRGWYWSSSSTPRAISQRSSPFMGIAGSMCIAGFLRSLRVLRVGTWLTVTARCKFIFAAHLCFWCWSLRIGTSIRWFAKHHFDQACRFSLHFLTVWPNTLVTTHHLCFFWGVLRAHPLTCCESARSATSCERTRSATSMAAATLLQCGSLLLGLGRDSLFIHDLMAYPSGGASRRRLPHGQSILLVVLFGFACLFPLLLASLQLGAPRIC